jgi:hypothetical protein
MRVWMRFARNLRPLPVLQVRRFAFRKRGYVAAASASLLLAASGGNAFASSKNWPPPPASKNVTISNGDLSVTFNLAWGAVVIGISNKTVAHGLNIVDFNDVGRELQTDQFLKLKIGDREELIINPTQAGAEGYQPYYRHPKGIVFPEKGSPVVRWTSSGDHFHAIIAPWDYDTGDPTNWVYVEDVRIDSQGVAHFHYTFTNHEKTTYLLASEVPTLYSDRTDAFMYPLLSPYDQPKAARHRANSKWPTKLVMAEPRFPQQSITSKGWIANIDTVDQLGIFYTTPVGFPETFGTFPGTDLSDKEPLGKTNVVASGLTSYPGEVYSVDFSVLVSTPQNGPGLISQQPHAIFKIVHNAPPKTGVPQ